MNVLNVNINRINKIKIIDIDREIEKECKR